MFTYDEHPCTNIVCPNHEIHVFKQKDLKEICTANIKRREEQGPLYHQDHLPFIFFCDSSINFCVAGHILPGM